MERRGRGRHSRPPAPGRARGGRGERRAWLPSADPCPAAPPYALRRPHEPPGKPRHTPAPSAWPGALAHPPHRPWSPQRAAPRPEASPGAAALLWTEAWSCPVKSPKRVPGTFVPSLPVRWRRGRGRGNVGPAGIEKDFRAAAPPPAGSLGRRPWRGEDGRGGGAGPAAARGEGMGTRVPAAATAASSPSPGARPPLASPGGSLTAEPSSPAAPAGPTPPLPLRAPPPRPQRRGAPTRAACSAPPAAAELPAAAAAAAAAAAR